MRFRFLWPLLVALRSWGAVNGAPTTPTYTLVDLGPGVARDINAAGRIVGEATSGGWQFDGTTRSTIRFGAHFLGAPADQLLYFTALSANSINSSGRIVGSVVFVPQQLSTRMAYVFEGGDVATLVADGDAFAVNNAGSVVGAEGPGFFYGGSGLRLAPGPAAKLLAVNDADVSTGSVAPSGVDEAATFQGNTYALLNLDPLNLPAPGPTEHHESTGRGINNASHVVGSVQRKSVAGLSLREWAFLHAGGHVTGLGNLGGLFTSPRDINTSGVIVGTATAGDGVPHAFAHLNGAIADLNAQVRGAYGWLLRSAHAVNDDGWIVGEGLKDGVQHAFVLRPVANALPPVIMLPPAGGRVFAGDPFELAVTASGTGPLSYQWQHAGTNLAGATLGTYTVVAARTADAGSYRVTVTNPFGSAASDDADVVVTPKETVEPGLSVALHAGLTIQGSVGQRVQILSSDQPDGAHWQPLTTVTLDTVPFLWFDPATTERSRRFYRTVSVP